LDRRGFISTPLLGFLRKESIAKSGPQRVLHLPGMIWLAAWWLQGDAAGEPQQRSETRRVPHSQVNNNGSEG